MENKSRELSVKNKSLKLNLAVSLDKSVTDNDDIFVINQ